MISLHTYQRTHLNTTIDIRRLITMYYFEFGKNYSFPGEKHHFWELVYMDRGEIEVVADKDTRILTQGEAIFHQPDEFHSFRALHEIAPNVIVITFDCDSIAMDHFKEKVIRFDQEERNRLAEIMNEGINAFVTPFRYPLVRRANAPIGSEQLIRCYLEALLIRLLRKIHDDSVVSSPYVLSAHDYDDELVKQALEFMKDHITEGISLSEISASLHVSKTKLKDLIKRSTGLTVMELFNRMKIERAKILMREQPYNFTEISQLLGFSSIHYFSKTFRKATGMSPTEYSRSIKSKMTVHSQ